MNNERIEKIIENLKLTVKIRGLPYGVRNRDKEKFLNENNEVTALFSENWCVGGSTGGNCYGDISDQVIEADEEEKFTILDDFFVENMHELTFMDYRKIEEKIQYYDYSNTEYYGNYTEYRMKYINIKDIESFLLEKNKSINTNKVRI